MHTHNILVTLPPHTPCVDRAPQPLQVLLLRVTQLVLLSHHVWTGYEKVWLVVWAAQQHSALLLLLLLVVVWCWCEAAPEQNVAVGLLLHIRQHHRKACCMAVLVQPGPLGGLWRFHLELGKSC